MYKIRNKVYADAGHILIGENKIGYVFQGELSEFSEEAISIDDMHVDGPFLVYSNGRIKELYRPGLTYEQRKTHYIKVQFSNDDQIAIILNKDNSPEDTAIFNKMQQWRTWSGTLAKKALTIQPPSFEVEE